MLRSGKRWQAHRHSKLGELHTVLIPTTDLLCFVVGAAVSSMRYLASHGFTMLSDEELPNHCKECGLRTIFGSDGETTLQPLDAYASGPLPYGLRPGVHLTCTWYRRYCVE